MDEELEQIEWTVASTTPQLRQIQVSLPYLKRKQHWTTCLFIG